MQNCYGFKKDIDKIQPFIYKKCQSNLYAYINNFEFSALFIYGWIILNSYATKLYCEENRISDECIEMDCLSREKCSNPF